MADTYYSDLARSVLNKAQSELQSAQQYLRDANLPEEVKRAQKIITSVRNQIDRLAYFESQKKAYKDPEPPA